MPTDFGRQFLRIGDADPRKFGGNIEQLEFGLTRSPFPIPRIDFQIWEYRLDLGWLPLGRSRDIASLM